jgi:3-oxoacyl-[acyl-carrier-protein] synthase-1
MNAARSVYIERVAHVSALGLSANAAAASLLAGRHKVSWREVSGARYPWFAIPLDEQDWTARVRRVIGLVGDGLAAGKGPSGWADVPLFIGSSSLQAGAIEADARARGAVDLSPPACFGMEIGAMLGVASAPWMFSTACTSGFAALEAAFTLAACGRIDEAFLLGVEFANDTTLAGFASLGLLAPTEEAGGLILGEAAGGLLLTTRARRGWRIAACRLCIDAHSPTAPAPDGRAIAANIAAALGDAGLDAGDIDLVKPHRGHLPGTDEAEEAAFGHIFGARRPPEISLKRRLGHTLGASGPAELSVLLSLLDTPAGQARHGRPRRLLFNLVGFGGGLAALIVERSESGACA